MAVMMVMTGDRKVMGSFTVRGPLRTVGWIATASMVASVLGMVLTALSLACAPREARRAGPYLAERARPHRGRGLSPRNLGGRFEFCHPRRRCGRASNGEFSTGEPACNRGQEGPPLGTTQGRAVGLAQTLRARDGSQGCRRRQEGSWQWYVLGREAIVKGATADPRQRGLGRQCPLRAAPTISSQPAVHGTSSAAQHRQC